MTTNACSSFARNASPSSTPVAIDHRRRPSSIARVTACIAPTSSNTSAASGLLNRNISTATGVSAIAAPAISPAATPNHRRIVAVRTATAATPSKAWGIRIDHELSPKTRTLSIIGHSDSGDLSTVIEFAASLDPNRKAFQLTDPAWTAAE